VFGGKTEMPIAETITYTLCHISEKTSYLYRAQKNKTRPEIKISRPGFATENGLEF
jgi:hypothetical protein